MNAIMMEQLEKASSSSTQNATAMWVIGNDKIGFPSYAQNNINWNTDKAFNLVPLTDTKYELILLVGQNVNGVNFKFSDRRDGVWNGKALEPIPQKKAVIISNMPVTATSTPMPPGHLEIYGDDCRNQHQPE